MNRKLKHCCGSEHLTYTYFIVYYESIKREIKIRLIYECKGDERLKAKTERSTPSPVYAPRIHWVVRGTGTPKDRDEVDRREV